MWHIGVRDEAKRLDGIGRCARQFCSASWLPELRPVKSSVAKDQRLSTLNPSQISGSCGRLMCCLRYEHEFYVKQRKRFPKEGKIIVTLAGEEKIVSNDIFREQVTLRGATGEVRVVPLAQLNHELGGEPVVTASDLVTGDDASEFEEEAMIEDDLVEPPRGVETRTYPEASRKPESRKPESRKPESRKPQAMSAPRPQVPQVPQQPQSRQAPQSPQSPQPAQPASPAQQQGGEVGDAGGRRRRRRGRRGGRRGREGGGTGGTPGGAQDGPPGTPPTPPAPPAGS
jgi:hypothetical protein